MLVTEVLANGSADLVEQIPKPPKWLQKALEVPRSEGYVNVNGCKLRFFRWGDKSKPGIIMSHGLLAHSRCFAFIAPFLAKDYHIVAFDMSGMGESDAHCEYSDELRVEEMVAVAKQTGLFEHEMKPMIIAHSYGSMISTEVVHAHPDLFSGLIICDLMIIRPSILEANFEKFNPPGQRDPNKPHRVYEDYETAKSRFVLSPPQPANHQVLFDYMAYHSLKEVDGGWSWKFSPTIYSQGKASLQKWMRTGERVATAPGNKAIVYGRNSLLFSLDSANYMRELAVEHNVPEFPIIDIPHARHHLMLDQPMALVTTLKTLLAMWEWQSI